MLFRPSSLAVLVTRFCRLSRMFFWGVLPFRSADCRSSSDFLPAFYRSLSTASSLMVTLLAALQPPAPSIPSFSPPPCFFFFLENILSLVREACIFKLLSSRFFICPSHGKCLLFLPFSHDLSCVPTLSLVVMISLPLFSFYSTGCFPRIKTPPSLFFRA